MADDERRAEIEAVARVFDPERAMPPAKARRMADEAIAALDRVRDEDHHWMVVGIDAIRALAACYDEQLLRSDHVLDDLLEDGRGWLRVSRDRSGPAHLALTMEGRRRIVALLIRAQGDA